MSRSHRRGTFCGGAKPFPRASAGAPRPELVAAFVVTHVAPTGDETAAYAKIPGEDVV